MPTLLFPRLDDIKQTLIWTIRETERWTGNAGPEVARPMEQVPLEHSKLLSLFPAPLGLVLPNGTRVSKKPGRSAYLVVPNSSLKLEIQGTEAIGRLHGEIVKGKDKCWKISH